MNLKSEQQRLYAMLGDDTHCFVRVCDGDAALWVSDLPRRINDHTALIPMLNAGGFDVRTDEKSRLWYVDWTRAEWRRMLDALPCQLPPLPLDEQYHEAYALCRLLMTHPAPVDEAQLPFLRTAIKLEHDPQWQRTVRSLHECAAALLRAGKPLPHAAGRLLAAWLRERMDNGKETLP